MKKTLSLVVAFSLILGLAVAVKADGLEKISHPSEIKNFGQIVKKGTALWGIRKGAEGKSMASAEKKETKKEDVAGELEKIPNLAEMNNFKEIKKIGTSLFGIRKEAKVQEKKQVKEMKKVQAGAVPCVKEAINAKDAALKEAFTAYSQTILTALDARNLCQINALDGENQIEANKACATTYQEAVKNSNKITAAVRNESWKSYTEKLKQCVKAEASTITATDASTTPAVVEATETPETEEVLNLEDGGSVDVEAQI
ncbi:hypothetical protein L6270_03845 [Candidatus Parcubacteria bacterium]|nr:hypothetical protein [Patescibacteria group bacterium]MBU4309096.1 hypothetical protein [Patescibacteria group bacterium]MBU4431942.1 hypothetical protein [Patescibacteria group bacterium]MBU4577457.1 hypothetical protein [Patescibacteria group bacterium]MCG2697145.1 hypothetical protein [Candidatus Parcubacteria bacterium]